MLFPRLYSLDGSKNAEVKEVQESSGEEGG